MAEVIARPEGPSIDYLALGHVTADVLPDGDEVLGGAVSYSAMTAAKLGLRSALVTRAESGFLERHRLRGVEWESPPASCTTRFANSYSSDGSRRQALVNRAESLRPSDIPLEWHRTRILHVAPVVQEVSADVVDVVRADFVGVSPQGWSRAVDSTGSVVAESLELPERIRDRADAIVVSSEDLAARPSAAEDLAAHVPVVVVTLGRDGARALADGREMVQAAYTTEAADPTGAGDVFAAALFVWLSETGDVEEALDFASAAAALSVVAPGLDGIKSRADVIGHMHG